MDIVLTFLLYFVIFYLVFKIFYYFQRKKKIQKRDLSKTVEIELLRVHFKVDTAKHTIKQLQNVVALGNALVFAIVLMGTSFIENYLLRLLGMFVLLLPVIYFIYFGISKILAKKGDNKNV